MIWSKYVHINPCSFKLDVNGELVKITMKEVNAEDVETRLDDFRWPVSSVTNVVGEEQ